MTTARDVMNWQRRAEAAEQKRNQGATMSTANQPIKAQWVIDLENDARLGKKLVAILMNHCGESGTSEGAVETLKRIIAERTHLRMQIGYMAGEMQIAGDKRTTPEIVESAAAATAG